MAAATNRAHAVVGWHWASPVPVQRLAEIVVTPATSDATIAVVVDAATGCGKNPIVVKDQPQAWGFVVNRILSGALGAARSIVDEGVASREQVDDLLRDAFGWPAGLFGMVAGASSGWGDGRPSSIGR
jgi:3-hydroxybutyryl-CoA dehydrogenase